MVNKAFTLLVSTVKAVWYQEVQYSKAMSICSLFDDTDCLYDLVLQLRRVLSIQLTGIQTAKNSVSFMAVRFVDLMSRLAIP